MGYPQSYADSAGFGDEDSMTRPGAEKIAGMLAHARINGGSTLEESPHAVALREREAERKAEMAQLAAQREANPVEPAGESGEPPQRRMRIDNATPTGTLMVPKPMG